MLELDIFAFSLYFLRTTHKKIEKCCLKKYSFYINKTLANAHTQIHIIAGTPTGISIFAVPYTKQCVITRVLAAQHALPVAITIENTCLVASSSIA